MPDKAARAYIDPNSKFCRWCQKRYANENVYNSHLNGKKHIQALERGGQKAEAERIRKKIQEAKIAAEAKKSQELAEAATDAAKRKAEEDALVRTFAQSSAQVPLYGGCGLIRGFITARG